MYRGGCIGGDLGFFGGYRCTEEDCIGGDSVFFGGYRCTEAVVLGLI